MTTETCEVQSNFLINDLNFLKGISENISSLIRNIFPKKLSNIPDSNLSNSAVHELSGYQIKSFLGLVDINLSRFYQKNYGLDWKIQKIEEMQEPGLVYVWYSDCNEKLIGFVSFMLTHDYGSQVLYLYEIHVAPIFQSLKVGSDLINSFHSFAEYLNSLNNPSISNPTLFKNSYTNLTVFSDNTRALNWYFKLGYTYTKESPRDKILRNRKALKPEFYLLRRANNRESLT